MAVQSSYSQNITKGLAGQLADINPIRTASGIIEETDGIDFGLGVIRGTDDDQIKLPSSSGDALRGITIHSHSFEMDINSVAIMKDTEVASVLQDGSIYVQPEQLVTPESPVYCRYKEGEQVSTLTFDGVLVTSNVIDMDVDGVAMTSVTFATSHAATMAAIAAQLVSDFPAKIQTVVVDGNTLEIIAQASINVIIDGIVVTLGAGQALGTWAVDRAYDSELTVGRFRADDGSILGIADTEVAFAVTALTYDESVAADGICKIVAKL